MQIEKMQDESLLDYHKRIIYGKLVDKTLADVDYTELSKYVYGHTYSSDVARRMMYGSRKTLDLLNSENIKDVKDMAVLSEIDKKLIELKKERQKFYDQRREYNKIYSVEAREEHLQDCLIAAAKDLSNSVGAIYDINYSASTNENTNKDKKYRTEAVLVFSDWHFGLKTSNVFNKYNTQICKDRVRYISESAAKRLKLHKCNKLHIVVLGDLFHGAIHNSARVASEELVSDQIMQASEILAQSVEFLSQYVDKTIVYTTYGNHARTVQNKNDSIHRDNMERLVPWWLEQRLKSYSNIKVNQESDNEFIIINACGYELCATHGDNDSVKNSPRLITTLFQKKHGKNIDYILLGDKHHIESFDELCVTAMLCGALCGVDDYANNKRLYSDPSQLLLILNNKDGVDAEYRLKC